METSSEADKIRRDKILAVSQSYGAQRGECTDSKCLKKKPNRKKISCFITCYPQGTWEYHLFLCERVCERAIYTSYICLICDTDVQVCTYLYMCVRKCNALLKFTLMCIYVWLMVAG